MTTEIKQIFKIPLSNSLFRHAGWVLQLLIFTVSSLNCHAIVDQNTLIANDTIIITDSDSTLLEDEEISEPTKEFDPPVKFTEKFYWESYIRARHEFWDNQEDLNNNLDDLYSFFRVKLYLGAGFKPTKNTQLYARIVNESRLYGHKGDGDSLSNDHFWRPERHILSCICPTFLPMEKHWRASVRNKARTSISP